MIKHNNQPIHVILRCLSCPTQFDAHETALRDAQQHAKTTGHTLIGEAAYRVEVTPND